MTESKRQGYRGRRKAWEGGELVVRRRKRRAERETGKIPPLLIARGGKSWEE